MNNNFDEFGNKKEEETVENQSQPVNADEPAVQNTDADKATEIEASYKEVNDNDNMDATVGMNDSASGDAPEAKPEPGAYTYHGFGAQRPPYPPMPPQNPPMQNRPGFGAPPNNGAFGGQQMPRGPQTPPNAQNGGYMGQYNMQGGQMPPQGQPNGYQRYNPGPQYPHGGMHTPPEKKTKEKNGARRGISVAALLITIVVCILFSGGAGFGGAFAYNALLGGNNILDGIVDDGINKDDDVVDYDDDEEDDTTVIHRVVETDESTSTGEKGIYTDVAATVKDSVVEITTEFRVTSVFQYVSEGAGSGVIISEDGYIITNNHVIADSSTGDVADKITVRLTSGKEYKAKLIGKDADYDIAVIKITADEKLSYAVFGDSDKLTVGEEVLAVGNPLGELGGTVTNGIISALDREINVDGTMMNLLQTNAAINPGNSGGGLFNMKGELIGVVNAKSSGSGIEGLGFAIPANDANDVAEQLIEKGYVTGKVFLGVSFYDVTDAFTAYRYFQSQATGVYVAQLVEGYNDDVLEYGDRVISVDDTEITKFSQIKSILKEHEVGDKLKFSVYRDGKLKEITVTCYEYVPEDADVNFDNAD